MPLQAPVHKAGNIPFDHAVGAAHWRRFPIVQLTRSLSRCGLLLLCLEVFASIAIIHAAPPPLRISVYATAGDIERFLSKQDDFENALRALRPLHVQRLFLEGRRGDEYVPGNRLANIRRFFEDRGIQCAGGIATVPGSHFGTRQNEALGWLNWQNAKTQSEIANFFTENAPQFDELIVDDFFCTGDTSAESDKARGNRSWSQYRRELLTSLIDPIMRVPARTAHPGIKLIIKFPQWYDRFQVFGYDPLGMAPAFDAVWVGTEVRDPATPRMGYVQPTEGYVNFRWISEFTSNKVEGAWFDHIECAPRHFVDQAFQSVLAGARELTLFHLGDILESNPADAALAEKLPELLQLAQRVQTHTRLGIPFYKPPRADAADNLYLMDYLTLLGWPILPVAQFPESSPCAIFGAHAAGDTQCLNKMRKLVDAGGTIVLTPALIELLGPEAEAFAGVTYRNVRSESTTVSEIKLSTGKVEPVPQPLEMEPGVNLTTARIALEGLQAGKAFPLLTLLAHGAGRVAVLNVRTFSEQDFRDANEWLLAPKPRGLSSLPQTVTDELRSVLNVPASQLKAPPGVGLYLFAGARAFYNFRDEMTTIEIAGQTHRLRSKECFWLEDARMASPRGN